MISRFCEVCLLNLWRRVTHYCVLERHCVCTTDEICVPIFSSTSEAVAWRSISSLQVFYKITNTWMYVTSLKGCPRKYNCMYSLNTVWHDVDFSSKIYIFLSTSFINVAMQKTYNYKYRILSCTIRFIFCLYMVFFVHHFFISVSFHGVKRRLSNVTSRLSVRFLLLLLIHVIFLYHKIKSVLYQISVLYIWNMSSRFLCSSQADVVELYENLWFLYIVFIRRVNNVSAMLYIEIMCIVTTQ